MGHLPHAWNNSTDQLYFKSVQKCNKISKNCNNNSDHLNYYLEPVQKRRKISKNCNKPFKSYIKLLTGLKLYTCVKTKLPLIIEKIPGLKLHIYVKTKLPPIVEKIHGENNHLESDSLVKVQCGNDIASSLGGSASQPHEHFLDPDNHNKNHLIYLKY